MIKLLFFLFILILTIMVRGSENPTKSDPLAVTNIFIGTFFDVEYTKEPQKIMINENNRFVVEKSTREILKDENGKEYYIADEDKPILLLDIPIYNDFGSFDTIMSSLARAADYYLEDCSKEEKNNEIFAYVRNTNKNYSTPMWSAVCGKSDKLINALANRYTGGLEFSEYFAAFLDKDSFNLELYPNTRKEYLKRHTYLMDPSSGYRRGTDLVHFIAAFFDGTCLNTGDSLDEPRPHTHLFICE